MDKPDSDYYRKKVEYIIANDLYDKENDKLKEKVYDVYAIRNEKKAVTGGIYNGEFYVSGFTTKQPKPVKFPQCLVCGAELLGKARKFCGNHDTCRNNYHQIRNKEFPKVKSKNKNIDWIIWRKTDEGKLHRKNIVGLIHKNGTYKEVRNVITEKLGKPKKQKKEFSEGMYYEDPNLDKIT